VRKLPPIPQTLLAGALANLLTSALIWLCTVTQVFLLLHIPVAAPPDLLPWAAERIVYGALAGVLFLAPLAAGRVQWQRGLLVALVPILAFLLVVYPLGREGWLGLNLGPSLPAAVTVFWLLWGALTGWLLARWGFRRVPRPLDVG
jgi:hypothetical protein